MIQLTLSEYAALEKEMNDSPVFIGVTQQGRGYLLPKNADVGYIHRDRIPSDASVVRMPYAKASKKSIMCFPHGQLLFHVVSPYEQSWSIQSLTKTVYEGLRRANVDCTVDESSRQSNDILGPNGRKIVGVIKFKTHKGTVLRWFVNRAVDTELIDAVDYPDVANPASERIGVVEEDASGIVDGLFDVFADEIPELDRADEKPILKTSTEHLI